MEAPAPTRKTSAPSAAPAAAPAAAAAAPASLPPPHALSGGRTYDEISPAQLEPIVDYVKDPSRSLGVAAPGEYTLVLRATRRQGAKGDFTARAHAELSEGLEPPRSSGGGVGDVQDEYRHIAPASEATRGQKHAISAKNIVKDRSACPPLDLRRPAARRLR